MESPHKETCGVVFCRNFVGICIIIYILLYIHINFVYPKKCCIIAFIYFKVTWLSEMIRKEELKGRGHFMCRPPEYGSL